MLCGISRLGLSRGSSRGEWIGCCGDSGGRNHSSGWHSAVEAKEADDIICLDGDVMGNALCTNGLEVRSVGRTRPSRNGGVCLNLRGSLGITKNVSPLLDGFTEIVVIQSFVTGRPISFSIHHSPKMLIKIN